MNLNIQDAKKNDREIFVISLLFITVSLVCLIINYSIENTISWAYYPVGGLIVICGTIVPVLVLKKNKVLGLLLGLTVTVIPYIFLIENLVSTKGWFVPLALPIAILSLVGLGVSLFALVNKRINKYYAVALTVFLFGVLVNIGVAVVVYKYLNENIIFDVYRISTLSISLLLSLILIVIGYNKRQSNYRVHNAVYNLCLLLFLKINYLLFNFCITRRRS